MATRLCASFCLDEEVGLYEVDRQIAAANSVPEGAPVGTIARRPDGFWIAHMTESGWEYTELVTGTWRGSDADSWPQIRPDQWPDQAGLDWFPPGEEPLVPRPNPTNHQSREELQEYFHKDLAEHCQADDPIKSEVNEVLDALSRLDGTVKNAVKLLTGFSDERLEELGGFSDPTAQQEPALRERFPEQASAYVADPELAEVDDEPLPSGSLITPKPRIPRVVDRLGVDEQGSRWQDRQLGEWKFDGQAWRYLELTWTSVPGGEWVEAEPSKRYGPYVEVLS